MVCWYTGGCNEGNQFQPFPKLGIASPHFLQIAGGIDAGYRLDAILLGASVSACEKGRKWEHAISLLAQATKLESYDFM